VEAGRGRLRKQGSWHGQHHGGGIDAERHQRIRLPLMNRRPSSTARTSRPPEPIAGRMGGWQPKGRVQRRGEQQSIRAVGIGEPVWQPDQDAGHERPEDVIGIADGEAEGVGRRDQLGGDDAGDDGAARRRGTGSGPLTRDRGAVTRLYRRPPAGLIGPGTQRVVNRGERQPEYHERGEREDLAVVQPDSRSTLGRNASDIRSKKCCTVPAGAPTAGKAAAHESAPSGLRAR
jgi:hypothetical protein